MGLVKVGAEFKLGYVKKWHNFSGNPTHVTREECSPLASWKAAKALPLRFTQTILLHLNKSK
jgi:hypothetical protein